MAEDERTQEALKKLCGAGITDTRVRYWKNARTFEDRHMTIARVWGVLLAAVALAVIIPACGSGSGVGQSQSLWISNAGVGGPAVGTPNFWTDPNLATSNLFTPDPYDIRTYTRPDIFILGNNHPLATDISAKNFPNIVFNEDRAITLLNQYRYQTFVSILSLPLPPQLVGNLVDHTGLRQNALAHCKHYANWHPTLAFPVGITTGATNPEGDDCAGRLTKCGLQTAKLFQLTAAGLTMRSPDDVSAYWIGIAGGNTGPLLDVDVTNMSVGFWQLGGTAEVYYWCCIIAQSPNTAVTLPTIPFGGPGF
jgi:hypothetical protein